MWFRKGTDMAAARFEVASAIRNLYAKLPEEVSYPNISLATSGSRESETLVYTIKADLPSERIEEYVSNYVSAPLSRIKGVGQGLPFGRHAFRMGDHVRPQGHGAGRNRGFGPRRRLPGLLPQRSDRTHDAPAGRRLRAQPRAETAQPGVADFGEIPVAHRNGRIYYLRDFASVRWSEALPTSYFRINGLNTINLSVSCEGHTNMLRVAAAVRAEMERLQAGFPPEISATLNYDASRYVSRRAGENI